MSSSTIYPGSFVYIIIISSFISISAYKTPCSEINNKYWCNFCEKHLEFGNYGIPERKNVLCKNCFSLERHRLLLYFLKEKTNIMKERLTVLHFAPERCLTNFLKNLKNIHYISADLYQPATMKIDITNIPLPDNSIDAIICNHVLEHIEKDKQAMREIFRILKPGGWAILQVPLSKQPDTFEDSTITSPEKRLKYYGQSDHVRIYGWKDYEKRLKSCNFIVTVDSFAKKLDPKQIKESNLSTENIYFCVKPKESIENDKNL